MNTRSNKDLKAGTITAIILAGGNSSRMEQDKRTLLLGGSTVVGRVIKTAESACSNILISSNDYLPDFGHYPVIPDEHPGSGPLNGLVSAMKKLRSSHAVVLTCDMPFVTSSVIRNLMHETKSDSYTMFIQDGIPQPFPGILPLSMGKKLHQHYLNGIHSFKRLFTTIPVHLVQPAMSPPLISATTFFNLNCPADLAAAREILKLQENNHRS